MSFVADFSSLDNKTAHHLSSQITQGRAMNTALCLASSSMPTTILVRLSFSTFSTLRASFYHLIFIFKDCHNFLHHLLSSATTSTQAGRSPLSVKADDLIGFILPIIDNLMNSSPLPTPSCLRPRCWKSLSRECPVPYQFSSELAVELGSTGSTMWKLRFARPHA